MTQTKDAPSGLVVVLRTTKNLTLKGLIKRGYSTPRLLEPWMEHADENRTVRVTRDDEAGRWSVRITGTAVMSRNGCAEALRSVNADIEHAVSNAQPLGVFWFGKAENDVDFEAAHFENGMKVIGDGKTIAKIAREDDLLSAVVTGPFEGPGALVFHSDAMLADLHAMGAIS